MEEFPIEAICKIERNIKNSLFDRMEDIGSVRRALPIILIDMSAQLKVNLMNPLCFP